MPAAYDRRKMAALVAVMATLPVFKQAVASIRGLVIAPSGFGYVRPETAGSLSDWFGQQAWERTQKEVAAGWCSPVLGGYAELNSRFGENNVRLIRRMGIMQNGACRCCDSATASGHNPCTSHEERLVNVKADFPMEAAAQFAMHLEIDGTWTMHVATNDVSMDSRCFPESPPRSLPNG